MNVCLELIHSVYDTKCYGQFLADKKRKTFLFGFLLVLIYYLITIVVPAVRFYQSTGGIANLKAQVPDFVVENSTVTVSRPVEIRADNVYIFVDTDMPSSESGQLKEKLLVYDRVLFMDHDQAVIKSNGQIRTIRYKDIDPDIYWTKEIVFEKMKVFVTIVVAAVMVLFFVGMELLFFFGVLFVALLGMIMSSCMQYPLTFGQLYKLGIYTRTTPLLIKAAVSFLPVGIPFYTVISIGISLLYLSGGIRNMKAPPLSGGPLVFSSQETGPVNQQTDPWDRMNP